MRVLIVDDDPEFRTFTTIALEEAGIGFEVAENAERGLEVMRASSGGAFDLVLLDVEMPGPSGWDLLLQIREDGEDIPVIFVTGLERLEERVRGLRLGADDYLVKPVEYEELIARMQAVVRRRRALTPIEFGDIIMDLARRKCDRNGQPTYLSPREFDLLLALACAEGKVVTRKELLREVWDMDFDPGTNVLDVHIGRVRRKLDRHGRPVIQTVRGEGYRLVRHEPESESDRKASADS